MDKQHKDLIDKNFEYLVEHCKSAQLLPKLKTKISILPEEYDELQGIKDLRQQTRKLFTFLKTKGPRAYDAIINALLETNQYTIVNKLKPGACDDHQLALQQIEEQKRNKVFIEQQQEYIPSETDAINISEQEQPLQVDVKKSSNFDYEQVEIKAGNPLYNTTSKNRGLVKIINIVKVEGKKERRASHIDVNNLTSLFTQVGCTVDVYNNDEVPPTRSNILNAIIKFVTDPRLVDADMIILFIMSHGGRTDEKDFISDSTNQPIYYKEIEALFSNASCTLMQNKPKMIFFQACRGLYPDSGVRSRVETDSAVMGEIHNKYMPTLTDLLVAYSTVAGHASHRDTEIGTWFIYYVCKVFMEQAHEKDVDAMLRIVYDKLRHERAPNDEGYIGMQAGEHAPKTFKKCYLNPGIYRENNEICYF